MDGPQRPNDNANAGPSKAAAPQGQGQSGALEVFGLQADAPILGLIMIMLLLGLMRWAMTPCVC